MKDKKLTILSMAIQNLKAKRFRTAFMMLFVILMSATFFFSTILMNSLELGIKNTTERMGADMIVVPKEGTEHIRDSLFLGTPCSIFFDKSWEKAVAEIDGVNKVSSQMYIASLAASCCDASVQMIAFDPKTDFVVQPWVKDQLDLELKDGEVILGHDVVAEVGETIRFYDTEFKVKAKLDRTGMGYDHSVFLTFETAYSLKGSEVAQKHLPTENMENIISMLMVDVDDSIVGEDFRNLRSKIQQANIGEKMYACTSDELMSGISSQIKKLSGYGKILTFILMVSTALAIISLFVITINERKYGFGILYSMGAQNKHITGIILLEALMISILGGIIGVGIAYYLMSMFKNVITYKLDIPYLDMGIEQAGKVALTCLVISILTGIIAAVCSAYRISKGEPYRLIREKE